MHPALRQGPHFYKNTPHCPPIFLYKKHPYFISCPRAWNGKEYFAEMRIGFQTGSGMTIKYEMDV